MELKHIAQRAGRLSSFLRQELGLSTGLMNRLKWSQKLFVNGASCHADHWVEVGDEIRADLSDPRPEYPAQEGALTVLYEDGALLAVDKPAGMLIHPSRSRLTDTLANFVLGYYDRTGQHCAFHPVTRLDRDTFGVVLLAKNAHIHGLLNRLQEEKQLEKTYHALVYGSPLCDQGIIDAPIARLPLPSLLRCVDPSGKPCVSLYRVLERRQQCAKLALRPITGRTHQLRVHCAHEGFPILGDPQYGSPESRELSQTLGLTTQALCARQLQLPHPVTGAPLCITSRLDTP